MLFLPKYILEFPPFNLGTYSFLFDPEDAEWF